MEPTPQHRRSFSRALALLEHTVSYPSAYERQLLASYQRGEHTFEQIAGLLEASPYQLLYHSQATPLPSLPYLRDILRHSQRYNAEHHITGLLLCSEGHFVQLLEGAEADVQALFAIIKADRRHKEVQMVSQGAVRQRHFSQWNMGFGQVAASALTRLIRAVQDRIPVHKLQFEDSCLQALWQASVDGDVRLPFSQLSKR